MFHKIATYSLYVTFLAGIMACCVPNNETFITGRDRFKSTPTITKPAGGQLDKGHIRVMTFGSADLKTHDQLTMHSINRNTEAVRELVETDQVIVVQQDTKVEVFTSGRAVAKVKLLDGEHAGRTVIISGDTLVID